MRLGMPPAMLRRYGVIWVCILGPRRTRHLPGRPIVISPNPARNEPFSYLKMAPT